MGFSASKWATTPVGGKVGTLVSSQFSIGLAVFLWFILTFFFHIIFETKLLTLVIKLLLCGGNPAKFAENYRRYTIPPIPGAKCKILQTTELNHLSFAA